MLFLLIILIVVFIQTGQTNLVIQCTPPFKQVGNQCLYFDALIVENYENARAVCHNLGGHSARITEPQQFKDIVDVIKENDVYQGVSYWLDADELENEGHFVYSNGVDVPMGTPFWDVYYSSSGEWMQEPWDPSPSVSEKCLILFHSVSLYFNDCPCDRTCSILCEQQHEIVENETGLRDISCPPLFVSVSGMCLAFLTYVEQTWAEARLACTSLGGQLANITQPQQLRDIYTFINQQGFNEDSFWIGGSDQETEGVWLYNDGSAVPTGTPFWGNLRHVQEPDGGTSDNCLTLFAPGYYYFRDNSCDTLYNPLCSTNPL